MISDPTSVSSLIRIFFAILTVDTTVLFLTRYFPNIFGKPLNDWYTRFRLVAVLSDVLIILIGFIIAQYLYTFVVQPMFGSSIFLFLTTLVIVQAIHDAIFYLFVIKPLPKGHNEVIDLFKEYSKAGSIIIAGDSLLMLGSAAIAILFETQPNHIVAATSVFVTYVLTYILYTKPQV